ncbi:MAG: MarR family transcriptional regulator [Rouxiella aceris]|jgi:DNA-binding MarR family transcriptional regulator|uniref:MarR family transcriptional regulator n=1 Tax=Rouxiella aceris TaxID=2703884 RepID=A0A848MQJ8_9GAMM|nr:MarR family transcriptional regulator [Rouxiella aceris]MDR3434943.1 MarR family transcriptional regulator [Rouxiella aceris]NMP29270.1 MarR family transcriptional regulator [Rouxiella aceris]
MTNSHNDDVMWLMHMIMHRYRARQFEQLRDGPYNITHMDGKVLAYLGRNPGASQGDLARFMERDKAQMARLIKGLRDKDLLTSEPDADDRRIVRLTLTARGAGIKTEMQQQGKHLSQLALNGLNVEEQQQLLALVRRVYDNFEQV